MEGRGLTKYSKEFSAHLFDGPEHPEKVEAGQLLELVHRPVPGVEQGDKELGVARHVGQTDGDSGMVALSDRMSFIKFRVTPSGKGSKKIPF